MKIPDRGHSKEGGADSQSESARAGRAPAAKLRTGSHEPRGSEKSVDITLPTSDRKGSKTDYDGIETEQIILM